MRSHMANVYALNIDRIDNVSSILKLKGQAAQVIGHRESTATEESKKKRQVSEVTCHGQSLVSILELVLAQSFSAYIYRDYTQVDFGGGYTCLTGMQDPSED